MEHQRCPFCAEEAVITGEKQLNGSAFYWEYWVACANPMCGAVGPVDCSQARAWELWDRRLSEPEVDTEYHDLCVERLEQSVEG